MTFDYLPSWKLQNGFTPAVSDEECDYFLSMEREWQASMQEWTQYRFRKLFGIPAATGKPRTRVDKEEVRERVDPASLLASYGVPYRKLGDSLQFLCPVHRDTKPSASFNLTKKIWRCFACQEGGDIFTFVMVMDNLTFPQAVDKLWRM